MSNFISQVQKIFICVSFFALTFFVSCSTCYDYGCVEYEERGAVDTLFVYDSIFVFDSVFLNDTLTKLDSLIIKDSVVIKDTLAKIDTVHFVDSLIIRDSVVVKDTLTKVDTVYFVDSLIIKDSVYLNDVIVVGNGGDYISIMDAVRAAPNYSTLLILPGVYDEEVSLQNTGKFLRFIGYSKELCVITHSNGDYNHATLEVAQGYFENLTFVAAGNKIDEGAKMLSYAVHVDYDSETNSSLQFVNCNFINDGRECVGIGLRKNFTLSFKGCSFVTHNLSRMSESHIIYCHEQQADGVIGQRIEIIDCSFYDDGDYPAVAIFLQETSAYTGNDATLLVQRSIMNAKSGWLDGQPVVLYDWTEKKYISGGNKWRESYLWNLDLASGLNNEDVFNVKQ